MKETFVEITEEDKLPQEKCGIFVAYSPDGPRNLFPIGYVGAQGVQTRGQQGAGTGMMTETGLATYAGKGLVREVFTKRRSSKLSVPATWIQMHTRYGTSGGYIKDNLQPCVATGSDGEEISVIHNGEFVNVDGMKAKLPKKQHPKASDTLIFTHLLANAEGLTPEDKVLNTFTPDKANGAISAAIGIGNKMFLVRDQFGIRPFIIGERDGMIFAASETHALNKVGARVIREIKRGEIVRVDANGVTTLREGLDGQGNFCDFEWCYYTRPDSNLPTHERMDDSKHPERWLSVYRYRERCGAFLADEQPVWDADFVVGVPDSGVPSGIGYANRLGKQYRQVIIRDHFDPNGDQRTFQRDDNMKTLGTRILGKLSFIDDPEIWQDKVVVVVDDSVVRGSVTKKVVPVIFSLGAREVHVRSASPQMQHPCQGLGMSIREYSELIAHRCGGDEVQIAEEVGSTSIGYISERGFIQARHPSTNITIPDDPREIFLANGGCGGCITGIYPISRDGVIYQRNKEFALARR